MPRWSMQFGPEGALKLWAKQPDTSRNTSPGFFSPHIVDSVSELSGCVLSSPSCRISGISPCLLSTGQPMVLHSNIAQKDANNIKNSTGV